MKIDKKKVLTLFALTLLITSLLLLNMNGFTSATGERANNGAGARDIEELIYLDGPPLTPIHLNSNKTLTPVHMHYEEGLLEADPECTWWHALYPKEYFCKRYHLVYWEDNGDGVFNPNDQINMTEEETGNWTMYHVDRITYTLNLSSLTEPGVRIFIEFKGPPDAQDPINFPVCTYWHEVHPSYSNVYHINAADGPLQYCTNITLELVVNGMHTGIFSTWHVDEVATDIILREKIIDPICTWWHAIYPEEYYCKWFHITSWEDTMLEDVPEWYGKLSPCDQIDMVENETGIKTWYHVDRLTVTLNVTDSIEYPTKWMKIELKTEFEYIYEVFKYPEWTLWHEVCPTYSNIYQLTFWDWMYDDNCNGVLDVCDWIWLQNITNPLEPGPEERWHIADITYDLILNEKISDPVCTDWHELYPTCCVNDYHIDDWEDNGDEVLSPCDNVTMSVTPTGSTDEYHVENVTLTLNLTVLDPGISPFLPGERIYIEFLYGFEWMYYAKIYPVGSEWEIVCPVDYFGTPLNITYWDDDCNGVLSYCDNIVLFNDMVQWELLCHIDEVAVDITVKKLVELVHDVTVDDVFSWYDIVYRGQVDPITVTVTNNGDYQETVVVRAFYAGTQAAPPQTIINMAPGATQNLTFYWDTTTVSPGSYTVSANATIPQDDNPGDNSKDGNTEEVRPFYWKESYSEYAPSGMPDFDQRQDAWTHPLTGAWSWCGPTAASNSLWWMDSRYHPSNITTAYPAATGEHDPSNVQPFIEHLAYLMDTDGNRTGPIHYGTYVWDMEAGIAHYLSWTGVNPQGDVNGDGIVDAKDLAAVTAANNSNPLSVNWNMSADIYPVTTGWPSRIPADNVVNQSDIDLVNANMGKNGSFYEHTVAAPDFYYIEEEVERCQDVVLLLGFWSGEELIDQQQIICQTCEDVGPMGRWQQFVPTANNLSRVEVKIARTIGTPPHMPISMTIESPLGNVLTAKTLPPPDVPEMPFCETPFWISFDVPDIPLTPGQTYYIVLTTPEPYAYHWCGSTGNPYPPGDSDISQGWDWTFKTFYEEWYREDGHYVTVAGVNSDDKVLAISDPCKDAFEAGTAPGRSPVPHMYPHVSTTHNNASFVSHDMYNVIFDPCPAGNWSIVNYPGWEQWHVQIEYAVITSPLGLPGVNITDVTPHPPEATFETFPTCEDIPINVTVFNNGTVPITFNLTVFYQNETTSEVGTETVTLGVGEVKNVTFSWNVSGILQDRIYTIKANATIDGTLLDEFINGQVKVRLLGDVNGDGNVNVLDMLALKIKIMTGISGPGFLYDVNCDGKINVIDMLALKIILST